MTYANSQAVRHAFGVPAVLSRSEAEALLVDLRHLWRLTYGEGVGDPGADLAGCRKFFDPITRGHSLRERLSQLPSTPLSLSRSLKRIGPPLVIDGGDNALLIGVEGRLLIQILEEEIASDDFIVIPPAKVAEAEHRALDMYRTWALARLNQVIDLRSGRGKEVMQAISVGVVLALLVNRSDSPERAVIQPSPASGEVTLIDSAVFAGAERFAEVVTGSHARSAGEQRLKGGYGMTEARRRLAHRLAAVRKNGTGVLLYVPTEYRAEVIDFIGRDLARRSTLTEEKLAAAFDQLVVAFHATSGDLAHQLMIFERPADTRDLRTSLLGAYTLGRERGEGQS
jgi:hypothetical protein